jgi:DMSO/TMAO reductase YedYZ molybdopterin-dependent catalytic subunit
LLVTDTSTPLGAPADTRPTGAPTHPGFLAIEGLVARPQTLTAADLAPLARTERREEFAGKDGGHVARRWRGIPLLAVVALARPRETARYVRVCAGSYALPVALADAEGALLCDALDGQTLSHRQGAPWRLLLPGADNHTSVKWIDRLEVTQEPGSYDAGCGRTPDAAG